MVVEDLGSKYGTRVVPGGSSLSSEMTGEDTHNTADEWRLAEGERRSLGTGDMIRMGNVLLRIEPEDVIPAAAPSRPSTLSVDPASRRIFELAERVAEGNISVLVLGETGVGKDVLASHIHEMSSRAGQPFVRIHCAALSENLLESELFGHNRGAFTGAAGAKEGLIESAHRGTVFLDEIGEMPLLTQVKLLNVLETSEVQRIGSTKPKKVDVRFIAATNRDLPTWVELGHFRRDLYFRINGITLQVPPLRDRPMDIEPLARHFFDAARRKNRQPLIGISDGALAFLRTFRWPGNLRELKNVMERSALLCNGSELTLDSIEVDEPHNHQLMESDFDENTRLSMPYSEGATLTGPLSRVAASALFSQAPGSNPPQKSRERVIQALRECSGNQTRAAAALGISRRTLINWLDEFQLPRPRKSS